MTYYSHDAVHPGSTEQEIISIFPLCLNVAAYHVKVLLCNLLDVAYHTYSLPGSSILRDVQKLLEVGGGKKTRRNPGKLKTTCLETEETLRKRINGKILAMRSS